MEIKEYVRSRLTAPLMGVETAIHRLQKALSDIHAMVDGMKTSTEGPEARKEES